MTISETDKQVCVAIVDDDVDSGELMQEFLESRGMPSERFLDAEALLDALPLRFTAILLDINLPNMLGSECGFQLRQLGYVAPIIAISGNMEQWNMGDLENLGFTCVLTKPRNLNSLINLLHEAI